MDHYFTYFASKGNHPRLEDILALENELIFVMFDEAMAKKMVKYAMSYATQKYQKPIGIRITYQGKIIEQCLMGEVKDLWLGRKEKVCLETGHSSYAIFLDNMESHTYDFMVEDESYGVCGGSFPLMVGKKGCGAITCTGLRPQEDHDVVVESIRLVKKEDFLK